jgi:FdhE protein
MRGTAAGLRTDPSARLADLESRLPEWHAWLELLGETERALGEGKWLEEIEPADTPPRQAPLLHRRNLRLDTTRARRLLDRLVTIASHADLEGARSLRSYQGSRDETVRLMSAAVRQDQDVIAAIARQWGLHPGAFASVIHLAALPLLRSCAAALQDQIPRHWPHGYCPICGAWPTLAERRGLDRSRRLRCGRCAAEWEMEWLLCVYCGERDHHRLGSLIPDESGELLKVETCATCQGYLKSVATLQAIPPFELLLQDLETVELDLVALDRGYVRPEESGFPLEVTMV